MLDFFSLIFGDYTLRTVALGAALVGVVSGALSSFAILRRQSLLGDAVSHAALPGVVMAFILTGQKTPLPLMVGALAAGWIGALLMMLVIRFTRIKQDAALGIVLAVFFGFGLVLLTWVQRQGSANQSGLDKFLFGQAAALVMNDVLIIALVGTVVLFFLALFWKEFKILTFDLAYTASLGFPARLLDVLLTTLIVAAIVIGLQTVGVVLMSAMLVAPGTAARQWTNRLGVMVLLAAGFGALSGLAGALISSLVPNLPTGPTIVLCISAIVAFSLLFAPNRGLVWDWARQFRNRRRLRSTAVLLTLYDLATHHGDLSHPHDVQSLRAALPGRGVRYTLRQLAAQDLIRQTSPNHYALTPAGVEQAAGLLIDLNRTP